MKHGGRRVGWFGFAALAAVSPLFPGPACAFEARVVDPEGRGAPGAVVYVCAAKPTDDVFYNFMNGAPCGDDLPERVLADAEGRFSLRSEWAALLLIVHDRGILGIKQGSLALAGGEARLKPWGRIEGELRSQGGTPPESSIMLRQWFAPDYLFSVGVQWAQTVESDAAGHYCFDRAIPGEFKVGPRFINPDGIPDKDAVSPESRGKLAEGGRETRNFNQSGAALGGRVILSDEVVSAPAMKQIHVVLIRKIPDPPAKAVTEGSKARRNWREAWLASAEGREHQATPQLWETWPDFQGSFHFNDIPPGMYLLHAYCTENGMDLRGSIEFLLAPAGEGSAAAPSPVELPLASAERKHLTELKPGDPAPDFEVAGLDGEKIRLEDYRGKFLLLDFWATWCGWCVRELPNLKRLFERRRGDPNFVMLSLSLDELPTDVRKFVEARGLEWRQGWLGAWKKTDLPDRYGVEGIPAVFLIGPDGTIRATGDGLRGPGLEKTITEHLSKP